MRPGDAERFAELYQRHLRAVLRYAHRRVGEQGAWDVAAETFLVAWRRAEQVPDEPLPWLYGVARRVVANELRRRQRAESVAEAVCRERRCTVGDSPSDALIVEVLRRLPAQDREALMLVGWEGLAPAEAARVAGCSRGAFTVRLHRARRRLERLLDGPTASAADSPGLATEGSSHA
jgi:RNA polymerase sigma-70 factor (ECF subfamily)